MIIRVAKPYIGNSLFGFLLLAAFSQFTPAQQPTESPNPYLKRLREAKEAQQATIRSNKQKGLPEVFSKSPLNTIKLYDYQIENALELIAEGGTFGKEEYDAAVEAVRAETRKALERWRAELTAASNLGEIDRRFADDSRAAMEKHRTSIDAANEKHRSTVAAANLKFKFSTTGGQLGIVIWNLPLDQSLHKRSTPIVNVRLFNGPKVVWNRTSLRLNRKLARNPIRLPNVMFDRVMIELPRWAGSGSGLSEVEVYVGKENIALGRPCEVSSIETLPMHLDDQHALTDGITVPTKLGEGYWIPEERTKATVMIDLLGKKVDLERMERDRE